MDSDHAPHDPSPQHQNHHRIDALASDDGVATLLDVRPAPRGSEAPPTQLELRTELLEMQQRLDAIIRAGETVHATAAADAVATQRLAHLARRVREFNTAVRERRRRVAPRPWQRAFWARSGYRPIAPRELAAERAWRQQKEETLRTMLRAGVTHHL